MVREGYVPDLHSSAARLSQARSDFNESLVELGDILGVVDGREAAGRL